MKLLTQFSGVILTGGESRRMGRDKALIDVAAEHGRTPLVLVAAAALRAAGAHDVTCIGGDTDALASLGLEVRPDEHPGEGPLGGLITGLEVAPLPTVVVLTCDLPAIDGPSVRGLVDALDRHPGSLAAMPELRGRRQVLTAAYRREALGPLEAAFGAGERSVRRALTGIPVTIVDHLDPAVLEDVDSPADLDRYARRIAAAVDPVAAGTSAPSSARAGDQAGEQAGEPETRGPGAPDRTAGA